MTLLLIVAAIVVYAPIHAYGVGRYQRAHVRVPFDEKKVVHGQFCNMHPRWSSLRDRGCDEGCIDAARRAHENPFAGYFWPITWPLGAALRTGKAGGKPILAHDPDAIEQAFKDLEKHLQGEAK